MSASRDFNSNDKSVPWYQPPITSVTEDVRDLLEEYSHVDPEKVVPYVVQMRDKIWNISAWPCVGTFRFMDLALHRQPSYPQILKALQNSATLLDVGCCIAQDIRKLVHDGAPSENLVGLEVTPGLFDVAYDFFKDRETFKGMFLNADIFDYTNPVLKALEGSFSVVHLGMVLHTWNLDGQTKACTRLVELLRPEAGVLIVGQAVGHQVAQETGTKKKIFRHNCESFGRLWKDIGEQTGTKWAVKAELDEGLGISEKARSWDDPNTRRLRFEVERL